MKINSIDVKSFGRFKDKYIDFDDGINVIYGPNEAGKSTIHKFIEAVFFGLFKPAVRRKQYLPEHEKYYPWVGERYEGSLTYSIKGTDFRIERNLLKGKDQVSIYNVKTGEDVTKKAEYNSSTGLYEPASLHFGISRMIYTNTLSIGQLAMKTDAALADEVRDILINLGSGKAEDISVKKAVDAIQKKLDDIGTPRAKAKMLGAVCAKLDELFTELKTAKRSYAESYDIQKEITGLTDEKDSVDDKIKGISKDIEVIKNRGYIKTINDAGIIISQNEELIKQINSLEQYEKIDESGIEKAIETQNTIKTVSDDLDQFNKELTAYKQQEAELRTKLDAYTGYADIDAETADSIRTDYNLFDQLKTRNMERQKRLIEINGELDIVTGVNDSINDDFYRYEELEREEIRAAAEPESIKMYQKAAEKAEGKKKAMLFIFIFSILLIPGLAAAGFFIDYILFALVGGTIGAIIAGVMFVLYKKKRNNMIQVQQELECEKYKHESNLRAIQDEMKELLLKNTVDSAVQLKKKFNEVGGIIQRKPRLVEEKNRISEEMMNADAEIKRMEGMLGDFLKVTLGENVNITKENVNEGYKRYIEYKETKRSLESVKEQVRKTADNITRRQGIVAENKKLLAEIFTNNGVADIEGYKEAVSNKKKLSAYIVKKENNGSLLTQLLKDETFESVKKKIRSDLEDVTVYSDELDEAQILRDEHMKRVSEIVSQIGRLEEQIKAIEKNNRPVVDIESDIALYNEQKNELELRAEAYKTAKETIEEISSRVRDNFAPELNKKAGEIMDVVTKGKYTKIMIDQNMTLRLSDSFLGRTVLIDDLSIGTIDQLYFATRFAILDLIRPDDALPLFLDDCFVNYDHDRMSAILGYIYEESVNKQRQILLFTCHEREMEQMDRMGYKYNRIELRD